MKQLKPILIAGLFFLILTDVAAQMPDRSAYQQRYNDCQAKENELVGKLNALSAEKERALEDLQQGYFCSKCNTSKSQFEKNGVNFFKHVQDVKGEVVPATPAQIAENQRSFNDKISNLERDINSNRQKCDNINTDYQQAYRDAQQAEQERAQAEQERAQAEAQAEAQRVASEQADRRRQAQEEADRRAAEEIERQRQAYEAMLAEQQRIRDALDANQQAYAAASSQLAEETRQKLDDYEQNSALNGLEEADDSSYTRSIVNGSDTDDIGQSAFGNLKDRLSGGWDTAKNYMKEKVEVLREKSRDAFRDQVEGVIFDGATFEPEEIPRSGWKGVVESIGEDMRHAITRKILAIDEKLGGGASRIYEQYNKYKEEASLYESRSLVQFNQENIDYISRGFDAATGDGDADEFNRESETFFENVPKRFSGVMRRWLTEKTSFFRYEFRDATRQ